jgi:hypothetical protein
MLNINVEKAAMEIKQGFKHLSEDKLNLAMARAINHTVSKAKTSSGRELREVYSIQGKHVKKALEVRKASRKSLTGRLMASARPVPLISFQPRQTQKGVSIRVKKSRKVIRSAFIATMPSGHKGVYARGGYRGKDFEFRKKRVRKTGNDLPIEEMKSTSIRSMYADEVIVANLKTKIDSAFPKRFVHELTRM